MSEEIKRLCSALAIPTVSEPEMTEETKENFRRFADFLRAAYPAFHSEMTVETVGGAGLLYTFRSGSEKDGVLFLSHMDTVPAGDEAAWQYPPFGAEIRDGYVYGRGALDMKGHLIAMLEAFERLFSRGLRPSRDVYVFLGCNEELMNDGCSSAKEAARLLEKRGVKCEFSLDEGGLPYTGEYLGLDRMIGLIGISERGYADVRLVAEAPGGHSAMPPEKSALGLLCEAGRNIEKHFTKARMNSVAAEFFDALAPHAAGKIRFASKHRKLCRGAILRRLSKYDRAGAMVKTTAALTMAEGSSRPNVLPRSASLTVNIRFSPDDEPDEIIGRLKKLLPEGVRADVLGVIPPSKVSGTDTDAYRAVSESMEKTLGILPLPYPVIFGTDSRYFYGVARDVYHFSPFLSFAEDNKTIHSENERIAVDSFMKGIDIFEDLISKTCLGK